MAGPPCFLDPTQFELNFEEDSIFPDLADFYRYAQQQGFDDRTIILMPGDSLEPAGNHAAANLQRLRAPCFTDKRNYLEVYQRDRQAEIEKQLDAVPIPDGPLLSAAQEYFQPLIASSAYFRRKIDGRLLLEITGRYPQDVIVDFTRANDSVYPHNDEDYFYVLRIEDRLLNLVLRHELSWEELLLSMRLTARRNPDQYNEFLVVFLRFANPESYRAYARYERRRKLDERTVVFENGVPYEIQRYCPHAMADLGQGEVIDGCVVCPGHGWAFRLNDGRCTTNPAVIAVRRLDAEM